MSVTLTFRSGPASGQVRSYRVPELTFGRDPGCTVPLQWDAQASRIHARIELVAGQWTIEDLGSSNGTLVNQIRIAPGSAHYLPSGSTVQMGFTIFEVKYDLAVVTIPPVAAAPPVATMYPAHRPKGKAYTEAVERYRLAALTVAGDGMVTDAEAQQLKDLEGRLGINEHDTVSAREEAASQVLRMAAVKGLLEQDLDSLKVLDRLGVTISPRVGEALEAYISAMKLAHLRDFDFPMVMSTDAPFLEDDEAMLDSLYCRWIEERVVSSQRVGGYSGFSFRVAKGVRYHVGGSRGQTISQRAEVPVDEGELHITSRRILFFGARKQLDARWEKVLSVNVASDGIQVYVRGRTKPVTLVHGRPGMADALNAIMSWLVNQY